MAHEFDENLKCRKCGLTKVQIDKIECQINYHEIWENPPIPCEIIKEMKRRSRDE